MSRDYRIMMVALLIIVLMNFIILMAFIIPSHAADPSTIHPTPFPSYSAPH